MDLQSELEVRRAEASPAYLEEIARAALQLQSAGAPASVKRVGERAPDFGLTTPDGTLLALSTLLRSGPVVIGFFRGEWCPFCEAELDALLGHQPAMARRGATLLLISPEPPSERLVADIKRLGPRAFVVQDPMLGVALQYGLVHLVPDALRRYYIGQDFDLSRRLTSGSWLLPFPADFVIDPEGLITLSYVEPDFTRRLDPSVIVESLDLTVGERRSGSGFDLPD